MKKKTVPSAEAKTQESVERVDDVPETASSSVDSGKSVETKETTASSEPSFVSFDGVLSKVDKSMLEKADLVGVGDLVRSLALWGKGVDAKFSMVGDALLEIKDKVANLPTDDSVADNFMKKLKAEAAKQQAVQAPTMPQHQSSGVGVGEIELLKGILGGGGASNPHQEKMDKLLDVLLDKAMENVTNPPKSSFEKYFEDELAKSKAKTLAQAVVTSG